MEEFILEGIYYIGQCPTCGKYGRLEIDKDIADNKYLIICEECLAEWDSPQDAIKNINGRRDSCHERRIRNASFDEIKDIGWDKFIVNTWRT